MAIHYQRQYPRIETAGENSAIIYFAESPSEQVLALVQTATAGVEQRLGGMLIDLVPSYTSLLVIYDVLATDYGAIEQELTLMMAELESAPLSDGGLVCLPVYYAPESGPDLERLAQYAGLSIEQVIEIHQQHQYRVYAIGFAPGFAYLGELDQAIAMPRLATPRARVPKGAVGIAERQTAVYPAASPGGWNIIGRCPLDLFNPTSRPPMPFKVGDRVQFDAISREEFVHMGGELEVMA